MTNTYGAVPLTRQGKLLIVSWRIGDALIFPKLTLWQRWYWWCYPITFWRWCRTR